MPGTACYVPSCSNVFYNKKKEKFTFFCFPKDPERRRLWLDKCKVTDSVKNLRICHKHFEEDDFQIDLQAKLMGLPPKRKLKETAVPSLNLEPRRVSSIKEELSLEEKHELLLNENAELKNKLEESEKSNEELRNIIKDLRKKQYRGPECGAPKKLQRVFVVCSEQ